MAWQTCPLCNGTGVYPTISDFIINTVCPVCNGNRVIDTEAMNTESVYLAYPQQEDDLTK